MTTAPACFDGTPQYSVPTRAPPVLIASEAVPTPIGFHTFPDTGQLDFAVPFRSEDAGEPLAFVTVLDLAPNAGAPQDDGTLDPDPRPFDEQDPERELKFTWTPSSDVVGCHSLTLILSHASNFPTFSFVPRSPERAAQLTWWFDFPSGDPADPTTTAECTLASQGNSP